GDPADVQSRYLEAAVGGVRIGCLYLPNGNPAPGPKFDYKLRWFDRPTAHAASLVRLRTPVVLAGDFNVIPEEIDVYKPASWAGLPTHPPRAHSTRTPSATRRAGASGSFPTAVASRHRRSRSGAPPHASRSATRASVAGPGGSLAASRCHWRGIGKPSGVSGRPALGVSVMPPAPSGVTVR